MILRCAVLAVAIVTFAPIATAQCTDDQLQLVANRYYALGDKGLKSAPIADALKQDLIVCAGEPAAHKIAALAFGVVAQRDAADGPLAMSYAELAMREVMLMNALMGSNPPTRYVVSNAGARMPIAFTDSYEVSKRSVHGLLEAERRAGRTINMAALVRPGDPPLKCDVHASSIAQQAAYWMKDRKGLLPGGVALVDGVLAACGPADSNGLSIRGYRADLMLSLATAFPAAPEAVTWLRNAMADSDAIFAQRPDGIYSGWKKSDLQRLDLAAWKVFSANNVTLPMDQWFSPVNLGKTTTAIIIAAQLDAAYAQDMAPGSLSTYPAYRAVLTPAFGAAKALPADKAREARKMLHLAAKRHADGDWRREANKSLKKPYDFLYNWIDPDYVPPPTSPQ
ncbi:MAG: hypothetical protein Q8R82_09875 [Hyphomonadaceae bacterium]|nr:hypothetical protein [Hyphomonadaceae bacterium]